MLHNLAQFVSHSVIEISLGYLVVGATLSLLHMKILLDELDEIASKNLTLEEYAVIARFGFSPSTYRHFKVTAMGVIAYLFTILFWIAIPELYLPWMRRK